MTARDASADETDVFVDRQILNTGLTVDRERLPRADEILALGRRLAVWEAIQDASELVQFLGKDSFKITEDLNDDGFVQRKEWSLTLSGEGADDNVVEDIHAFHKAMTEDLIEAAPARLTAVLLDEWIRPNQLSTLQDLLFGPGMVAIWREQRTPTFDDQPMEVNSSTHARRMRRRP
jgi:hypothetical protein